MNTINITPIIEAIISLVTVIITVFIIPWIKSKMTAERYSTLQLWCRTAVSAAEMLYKGGGLGKDKLEYALTKVTEMVNGAGYKFDEKTIRAAIEEAVKDIKYSDSSVNNNNV